MPIAFGSFDGVCQQVYLSLCPWVGVKDQNHPPCYARNVEIAGSLVFQPATLIMHFVALVMTSIMIYHITKKYTAVGRREIVMFFYLYMACTFCEFLLVSEIIPPGNNTYPYFAALHVGLITTTCWCLFLNGLVGFQLIEDGSSTSLWIFRSTCFVILGAVYFVAIATFTDVAGFSRLQPVALWIIYFVFNGVLLGSYYITQIVLVMKALQNHWPIGDITFAAIFFVIGLVILFALSDPICDNTSHYTDGLFFGTMCILVAVMMVYKYWDSITKEDLEFAVDGGRRVWDVNSFHNGGGSEGQEFAGADSGAGAAADSDEKAAGEAASSASSLSRSFGGVGGWTGNEASTTGASRSIMDAIPLRIEERQGAAPPEFIVPAAGAAGKPDAE